MERSKLWCILKAKPYYGHSDKLRQREISFLDIVKNFFSSKKRKQFLTLAAMQSVTTGLEFENGNKMSVIRVTSALKPIKAELITYVSAHNKPDETFCW